MQGRNVRFKGKYDLFTIYLIPGVTIFLASFDSWTGTNLSVLGNRTGNKLLFAVWGFATGIYYCVYVRYLFHIGRYRNPGGRTLMYTAAAFLLMAVYDSLYAGGNIPFKGGYPCAACIFFACASGLQYHWLPPLSQLPRPDAFSQGMGHPVDDGSLLRPLPPREAGLSPVFWKYSLSQACAGICAIWNSFWHENNTNVEKGGKDEFFPTPGSKNKPFIWSVK